MFLAGERHVVKTEWMRNCLAFHDTDLYKGKTPFFGPIRLLHDVTVAGGTSFSVKMQEDGDLLVLPVVGALNYSDLSQAETLIQPGEIQFIGLPKDTVLVIKNPFPDELINFLLVGIATAGNPDPIPFIRRFHLDTNRNQPQLLSPDGSSTKTTIVKLEGRQELLYPLSSPAHGLFAFVLEGAFEVQHRLLEPRDGMGSWNVDEVEIEALSNDAILLLLEVPLDGTR